MATLTRKQHADRIFLAQIRMQDAGRVSRQDAGRAQDALTSALKSLRLYEIAREDWNTACIAAGKALVPASAEGGG